jgi:hypothetical protein
LFGSISLSHLSIDIFFRQLEAHWGYQHVTDTLYLDKQQTRDSIHIHLSSVDKQLLVL